MESALKKTEISNADLSMRNKAWPSECDNSLLKIGKIDNILSRVNNIINLNQKSFKSENDLKAKRNNALS